MDFSTLSLIRYQRETENCGTSASTAVFLAESVSETEICSWFFEFTEAQIVRALPTAPSLRRLLEFEAVVPVSRFVVESLTVLPEPVPLSPRCQTPV